MAAAVLFRLAMRARYLTVLLITVITSLVQAQTLSFGVVGGGALTDSFPTIFDPPVPGVAPGSTSFSSGKDYLIGPSVELHLLLGWSVEVNGLYRKLHYTWATVEPDGTLNSVSPSPVITWEFPVLAKYRFRIGHVTPFLEAGPSFRTAGNLNGANPSHYGVTAGAGMELHTWKLNIAPALRYSRWQPDDNIFGPISKADQLELVLGVSGGSESLGHPLGGRLAAGVAAGTGLTDALHIQVFSSTFGGASLTQVTRPLRSAIVGPMVEFFLPAPWSLETDALYRPFRTETVTTYNGNTSRPYPGSYATWEIPVIAKYRFAAGRVLKPFLEAGLSFRISGDLSNHGFTGGAGIETSVRIVKIAPVLRYTHWAAGSSYTNAIPNQLELLVGFAF